MSSPRKRRSPSFARKRRNPPGTPPGTLTVDPAASPSQISAFGFAATAIDEQPAIKAGDLARLMRKGETLWVDMAGLGDGEALRQIGMHFDLHPLALEDVVNLHQRPKFEDYESHHFVVMRMPDPEKCLDGFQSEQVSLCFGPGFVTTFQERPGDVFDPVRRRLRNPASQLRRRGADYLAYTLIDAVIDSYFPVLEQMGERVEALETSVIERPDTSHIGQVHSLKHDLLAIRRAVWPMRDMLAAMLRDDSALIDPATHIYLRDCHDHTIQLIDMIETYREIASGLVDLHLSSLSNRTNEVMQVLTLIATIFIPLTFIVGVYGMNFDPEAGPLNMPELGWRFGYPVVMGLMLALAVVLVLWFHRKGWLTWR